MTVAAVILAASPESALADADGMPGVRRIVDVAWSGGATPIVVVSFDPAGAVAAGPRRRRGHARRAGPAGAWPEGPDGARRRGRPGRGRRHRRRPPLAGPDDLGRPRDGHVADRAPRVRPGRAPPPDLGGRARLAGGPAARRPRRAARRRRRPDAAADPRRPDRGRPGRPPRRSRAIPVSRSTSGRPGPSSRRTSARWSLPRTTSTSGARPRPMRPTTVRSRARRSPRTGRPGTSTSAGLAGGVVGRGATAPLASPISARVIQRGLDRRQGHRSPQPRCLPSVAEQQVGRSPSADERGGARAISRADIGPASRRRRYAGALRTDARSRSNGTVATAIPPITRTTPRSWFDRRRLVEQDDPEHDRHHRLGEQDDRGQHGRQPRAATARSAGSRATATSARAARASARLGRGRGRVQVADDDAREGSDERRRDRRDRDRPGRPPQVAAAAPDDEQVAGVAQRGRRARTPRRARGRRRTPGRRSRRRSGPPRRSTTGRARNVFRDGRSPNASHATTPTIRTWRLPRTVASPAPTYSIAWCQNRRSPAKKTPANSAIRTVRPGSPPKRAMLEVGHERRGAAARTAPGTPSRSTARPPPSGRRCR